MKFTTEEIIEMSEYGYAYGVQTAQEHANDPLSVEVDLNQAQNELAKPQTIGHEHAFWKGLFDGHTNR